MTAREVELTGGAPWGFRMHGGVDQNQPLRISRVNPGRKASLSGIREGDVISSINGRPTRSMSNNEAHVMLRSAGPVLRLGLNEDREVSPRRRSVIKGTELKRPSQLLAETQNERATPQAPVYATIHPSQSPVNRSSPSTLRASLSSLSSTVNSTPIDKFFPDTENTLRFHPTNPFYTTLPSNYSKLPVPNGRLSIASLDRSKSKDTSFNISGSGLKSPSYILKSYDFETSSQAFPQFNNTGITNGYEYDAPKSVSNVKGYSYSDCNQSGQFYNQSRQKAGKNPFETKRNSDPFEKYLRKENKIDDKNENERAIPNSKSDNSFNLKEEITERSTIIEHKINKLEEVKTVKKILLNGCEDPNDVRREKKLELQLPTQYDNASNHFNERIYSQNDYKNSNTDKSARSHRNLRTPNQDHTRLCLEQQHNAAINIPFRKLQSTETPPTELVSEKPPVKSVNTPTTRSLQSPTTKPVWRPGALTTPTPPPGPTHPVADSPGGPPPPPPPPPPIWSPGSAGPSPQTPRKTFKPVNFDETPPPRRKFPNSEQNGCTSGSESEGRLRTSQSAPVTGLSSLSTNTSRLPRAQNPTVTLLQKAREGQIPRVSSYLQQERDSARLPRDRPSPPKGDIVHALRKEYASEGETERSDYERGGPRKMADDQRKIDGIGPTTKDGMPVALRSEVKDPSKWYKKMYDTIHKNKYDDDYVTIRYKSRRGQPPERVSSSKSQYAYFDPRSGYLSEPEGGLGRLGPSTWSDAYDSDVAPGHRRRTASVQEDRRISENTSSYLSNNKYSTLASARASQEVYKNQPGRIEDYIPGKSSVVDKEAKQWWDEVMDIFDGWLDDNSPLPPYTTLLARAIQKSQNISSTTSLPQPSPKEKKDMTSTILSKSNMARALKESGYESDSTLVFRRREDTEAPLSPAERRAAYRDLQAGGEPPLRGFRSPAPPRLDETEIEYIPISPTLTKIRVHKKTPQLHEVICYPITKIYTDLQTKSKVQSELMKNLEYLSGLNELPPAPPQRISSKNSRTLKLITSTRPTSILSQESDQGNSLDVLKKKLNHNLLSRQNTQIISKTNSKGGGINRMTISRGNSTSAPPTYDRKRNEVAILKPSLKNVQPGTKTKTMSSTSSFSLSKRTLPTEYSNSILTQYGQPLTSVIIEGGAGRRTPITNILDKMTSLDKLWSTQKRNERIDPTKINKNISKNTATNKPNTSKVLGSCSKPLFLTPTHKSRDMIRTAEKIQKLKTLSHTKSNPNLSKTEFKTFKSDSLHSCTSKSSANVSCNLKKQNLVKTASITNLKKKKSLESIIIRPRSVPYDSCKKKSKDLNTNPKKVLKNKPIKKSSQPSIKLCEFSDSGSQFGDTSNEASTFAPGQNLKKRMINAKEIQSSHDAVVSDSFFQHLFLGRSCNSILTYPAFEHNKSVLEKTKIFQTIPRDTRVSKSLNSYLIHRKPVSLSRFKIWDRHPCSTVSESHRSISWPGRTHNEVKKFDSLIKGKEFGSSSSLISVRSKSEPPATKLYFSQTSRPKSPIVIFFKKSDNNLSCPRNSVSPSRSTLSVKRPIRPKTFDNINNTDKPKETSILPSKTMSRESLRSTSPIFSQNIPHLELGDNNHPIESYPSTIFFSETSRPISPRARKITKSLSDYSRSQSTSPVSLRSPSYRRIHSARIQSNKSATTNLSDSLLRTYSAGDAEKKHFNHIYPIKTKSDSNLHELDYDEYAHDMQNTKTRSERFKELNTYYTYLERVAELEKTTSTSDLRHRKKDEEIIDFDRWKKIRGIERAENELNNLYTKLKIAQIEKDVLFYTRDLNNFRWNYNRDRGLRIKEKSVEDLKDHFQQKSCDESEQNFFKDTYKPLWRGSSVAETAFYINKKNQSQQNQTQKNFKPTVILQQEASLSELRKKIGLGNRLWSSLSVEQVNALKHQLNSIYSKELGSKSKKEYDTFTIDIKDNKNIKKPSLHVRCNSLITSQHDPEKENKTKLCKSESIAAMSCPTSSLKELKNNANKMQMNMSLSENEKRKISQTLSKELLDRINKFDNPEMLTWKQKIYSIINDDNIQSHSNNSLLLKNKIDTENETHNDTTLTDKKRHVIYPNEISTKNETTSQSSTSETETASSDISNKTVIYRGPNMEVKKKVEYFESVRNQKEQAKVIYHARENSDEKIVTQEHLSLAKLPDNKDDKTKQTQHNTIIQSQSCTNFKELFGECEQNKFLSLPCKPELRSTSTSPHSEVYVTDRRTPDTLCCSSDDTIWHSRSPSPDPERYWRSYLNLARAGEVRRLAKRFDLPSESSTILRRYRSDPEIARNILNQNWSSIEKVTYKRDKNRAMLPVARIPLRSTNRFMPHIDIISKLAALRRRTVPRSRSAEEALECRPGEVDRIRRRFETISLLGQLYASAPDVSELHDIAPYLAGSWIAHRYPKPSDNNRCISKPSTLVGGKKEPVRKESKKTATNECLKLSSILKQDSFSQQKFDPSVHRPISRYEPPRAPPRPPPASWPQCLSPFGTSSRHTVTFQESDSAPEPPRRTPLGSFSDTESPRRYVEGDVNIHYKCPVRYDPLPLVPERELARQQAEHMKRLYREQRRNKYLQELQDMQNRRHQDNFTPSQKTVVPLNRYDEAEKVIARALYTFNGQTNRELSFKKGDLIHVRRQIDSNWYEGEVHERIGLFPYNYVEIQRGDVVQPPKKPALAEGRARAKFDFTAQTNLELPLKKGEIVVLTRRIDQNWWEGRNGVKTGIFPDSYITVLQEPSQNKPELQGTPPPSLEKPLASPAAHGLVNGSGRRSMGAHRYTPQPNSPALANAPPATQPLPGYTAKPAKATLTPSERGYGPPTGQGVDLNNTEPLYVDTNAEAIPYRAMYKYRPQNPDELELNEGDTVYVLEKCDDGWYVGSSQRTGRFGTFPGNYVERI